MSDAPAQPKKPAPLLHLGHPESHIPLFDVPETPSPQLSRKAILLFAVVSTLLALLGLALEHAGEHAIAPAVSWLWMLPFLLMLLCIATMPFIARHFWEQYYPHIALGLGLIVITYYVFFLKLPAAPGTPPGFFSQRAGLSIAKTFAEYISFLFLMGSLYIISGGILIRVRRKATPAVNTGLLLTGAIIANIFGTTGAAMLLIRPYLRINKGHIRPFHIVFFIFIVANVGGSLTPIGDPPLFLGYLKGVPFWWVAEHCWPMWLVAVGILLALFFLFDSLAHRKQHRAPHNTDDLGPAVSIFGISNLLLVFAVLAGILLHDQLVHLLAIPWRELIMVAAVAISLATTPRRIHLENVFNFAPIKEVALLFIGIFATMVPALNYLAANAREGPAAAYLSTPGQFYYSCGSLSAVLDNAPTYLTFLETQLGKLPPAAVQRTLELVKDPARPGKDGLLEESDLRGLSPDDAATVRQAVAALWKYYNLRVHTGDLTTDQVKIGLLLGNDSLSATLIAISLGAVFFGAMTYIGNGPNFMVKSIAENAGIPCPTFFRYILQYALPLLLPVLILIWALFLMKT